MPLSKAKQAEYMRNYRANKKTLGITHPKTREFTNPVIPKLPIIVDKPPDIDYIDADGYPVYDD